MKYKKISLPKSIEDQRLEVYVDINKRISALEHSHEELAALVAQLAIATREAFERLNMMAQ